jgi:hypothetical protein
MVKFPSDIEIHIRLAAGESLSDILTKKTASQVLAEAKRTGRLPVQNTVEVKCQCGQLFVLGDSDGVPVGLHYEPFCREFIEKDLPDYVEWLNTVQGRRN